MLDKSNGFAFFLCAASKIRNNLNDFLMPSKKFDYFYSHCLSLKGFFHVTSYLSKDKEAF